MIRVSQECDVITTAQTNQRYSVLRQQQLMIVSTKVQLQLEYAKFFAKIAK